MVWSKISDTTEKEKNFQIYIDTLIPQQYLKLFIDNLLCQFT